MPLPELVANSPTPGADVPIAILQDAVDTAVSGDVETWHFSNAAPVALQALQGQFRGVIGSEIVLIDASSTNTYFWSVQRGQEGSTTSAHSVGTAIYHRLTAGGLNTRFAQLGTDGSVGGPGGSPLTGPLATGAQIAAGNLGATATLDFGSKTNREVIYVGTLTANCTLTLANRAAGAGAILLLSQDATGGRTLTLSDGASTQAVTINTLANAITAIRIDLPNDTDVYANVISPSSLPATVLTTALLGVSNGIATLDGGTKIPIAQIPSGVLLTTLLGVANGVAQLDAGGKVPIGQVPTSSFLLTTQLGAASGVAELDSTAHVPTTEIPTAVVSGASAGATALQPGQAAPTRWNVVSKTAPYTAVPYDFVKADATGGAFAVAAPGTPTAGDRFTVKKMDASANAVTITATVDGVVNPTLIYRWQSIELIYDGTAWSRVVRMSGSALVDYGLANGVPQLDAGAKVPIAELPAGTASGLATLDANSRLTASQHLIQDGRHVPVSALAPPTVLTQGTWSTLYDANAMNTTNSYNNSNAQNDEFRWYLPLAAGTWRLDYWFRKATNAAIVTWEASFDAAATWTAIGTVDQYAAAAATAQATFTGLVVPAMTQATIVRARVATRNASNTTGWVMSFSGFVLTRTA